MFIKHFTVAFGLLAASAVAAPSGEGHTHTPGSHKCDHSKDQFFTGHIHSINHFDFKRVRKKHFFECRHVKYSDIFISLVETYRASLNIDALIHKIFSILLTF